uniref:RING-type domain-containing protein n=1 Tax=Schistocephalus solidus TaxID=70667 RepID=A0A183TBH5_SCHSO
LYKMPLFKRKMPPERQRILENKLHIAQESRDAIFDLSEYNLLSSLPESLGDLTNLQELCLDRNPLQTLPAHLGCLRQLKKLTVPLDSLLTPQRDVCEGGISSILSFLRRAGNIPDEIELNPAEPGSQSPSPSTSTYEEPFETTDSAFYAHQLTVKRRHNENLHKELVAAQKAEALAAQRALKSRNSVLNQLVEEGSRNEAEVCLLQKRRDARRRELLSNLRDAESHADELIRRLCEANEAVYKREAEWEAAQTEVLNHSLTTGLSQSSRLAILDSMQETLRASEAVIARQNRSRDSAKQQLHTDKVDSEKALTKVLDSRHLDKLDLTARIANEEAFRRLQELRDLQSQRIIQEIRLVEQELCRLTQAEQERKRTSSQQAISSLAEQRGKLLQLLQSLQKAKDRRETELQNRLVELEARKLRDQTDYWLVQYQRLMDKKPVALFSVQLIDPDVYKILEAADAMDYAANFEYHRITSDMLMSFTDADLLQVTRNLCFHGRLYQYWYRVYDFVIRSLTVCSRTRIRVFNLRSKF